MKVVAEPLLVPAAKVIGDDFAERMRERVEARRRAVAAKAVELAGTHPKGVLTDRTLVNVMQGAATVDDPDIQEMFARLLASEATGTTVHPSFPSIVKDLSSSEAVLLYEVARGGPPPILTLQQFNTMLASETLKFSRPVTETIAVDFQRLATVGLLRIRMIETPELNNREWQAEAARGGLTLPNLGVVALTSVGERFVACILPPRE